MRMQARTTTACVGSAGHSEFVEASACGPFRTAFRRGNGVDFDKALLGEISQHPSDIKVGVVGAGGRFAACRDGEDAEGGADGSFDKSGEVRNWVAT